MPKYLGVFCLSMILASTSAFDNLITPPPLQSEYEFWLYVDYRLTMAVWNNDEAPPIYFNFTGDQKYYYRKNMPMDGCTNYQLFTGDLSKLTVGDGRHRDVIAVNDSIPAPALVVYSGSTMIVHVTNYMDEPTSIHWHGLDQRGTFFMDGVAPLTQCPIARDQTFTYRFKVTDPPGTYWYHAHTARARSDGLYGPLIILDPATANQTQLQNQSQELIAVISDWYNDNADYYYKRVRNDNNMFTPDYEDQEKCYLLTRDIVGTRLGVVRWDSAVVNGRGWHDIDQLVQYADRLPLEQFKVSSDPSRPVKIRLINAGMVYGLLFSVDDHRMTMTGADGVNALPVQNVDYIVLNPGERFDVILAPIVSQADLANRTFPVRIRSMERFSFTMMPNPNLTDDHFSLAWLVYDQGTKPTPFELTETRQCTSDQQCLVINCPFELYPPGFNRTCTNMESLRSTRQDQPNDNDEILRPSGDNFEQHFLNYGFQDHVHTINGMQFRPPAYPPFLHSGRESEIMRECGYECGRTEKCSCAHHINLTLGNVVELVLYNHGPAGYNALTGFGHPVHLHGHHFYVLKTAWPTYDNNGLADQCTEEVTCDNFYCDLAHWNVTSGVNRTVPGANGKLIPWQYRNDDGMKPVLKDTVYIPFGGYVVVRFKADNPGWWFSHCHIMPHASDGMAMFFREGTPDQIPTAPADYPVCGMTYGQIKKSDQTTTTQTVITTTESLPAIISSSAPANPQHATTFSHITVQSPAPLLQSDGLNTQDLLAIIGVVSAVVGLLIGVILALGSKVLCGRKSQPILQSASLRPSTTS